MTPETNITLLRKDEPMTLKLMRPLLAAALLVAALALAACGGDDDSGGGDGTNPEGGGGGQIEQLTQGTATENDPNSGKKGGSVTMLSAGDVDYIDPGQTYYSYALGIHDALHRKLYSYKPDDAEKPVPDLAESDPEISEDGKTVTVKIRKGVKFTPPVNREVTSKDVKYAIERTFSSTLANGYSTVYFKDIVGAPEELGKLKKIEGIETPDDQTIVFKLDRPTGAVVAGALALPATAPVPEEYARKFDAESPSTYGLNQVFTGPYMIKHNAKGKLTGYKESRLIDIVRNPDYVKAGDFRPAYLDAIRIEAGNEDTNVSFRRILGGSKLISGDGGAPPTILRTGLRNNKEQVSLKPSGGVRWISMDTSRKPFNDINVRKAVLAGIDRNALRQQRGGPAIGPIAQGYIAPGIPGFEESGSEKGFGFDFMAKPEGDKALMAEYFKKAGFESGKYEGNETVLMVGDSADPDKSIAQSAERQLKQMGFNTKLRLVSRDTMFTRFCQRPKADQHICPSVGWLKDFADPQTLLQPTFSGDAINPANNNNWSELDVDAIDDAMKKAETLTDPGERAQAWADINKQIVAQAPAIPYVWDYENNMASKDVKLIQNQFSTVVDLSYTSLK